MGIKIGEYTSKEINMEKIINYEVRVYPNNRNAYSKYVDFFFELEWEAKQFTSKIMSLGHSNVEIITHGVAFSPV